MSRVDRCRLGMPVVAWAAALLWFCQSAAQGQSPRIAATSGADVPLLQALSLDVATIVPLRAGPDEKLNPQVLEQRLAAMAVCQCLVFRAHDESCLDSLCRQRLVQHGMKSFELDWPRGRFETRSERLMAIQRSYCFLASILPAEKQARLRANYRRIVHSSTTLHIARDSQREIMSDALAGPAENPRKSFQNAGLVDFTEEGMPWWAVACARWSTRYWQNHGPCRTGHSRLDLLESTSNL